MPSRHSATSRFLTASLFDGLTSFDELEARISALPSNKGIGDAFEVFAEAYLATQKITQAHEVWPFESIPLEQRKVLGLDTGTDKGVDGAYVTADGELCAYQVKFRSGRPSLTWEELSTFMGLTDQVSQRVLFTNCESLPKLMRDRSGFIAIRGSDLDRLTVEDFDAMRQWLKSGQVKLPRKQPLPHQQVALDAISSGLNDNDRATVVMACGTGKTLVALWAAERRDCHRILVLVPSLALVRQLLHEWLRETVWENLIFLCVCSDPTVAKGADDLIVHQADLDFPVTTASDSVREFLTKPFGGVKVIFSTYQSAHVVAAGMMEPFDLGIFDEAHKTASREGTRYSFAIDNKNLPIRKRLFFTATPRHYDVSKRDKEGEATLVYSMDRPEIYGPVVHTLTFAEAARRGIICDYKVVISVVTSAMLNDDLLSHGEVIVDGNLVKARQVASQIALQNAVEKYGVTRIFTFHGSVAAARSFTSEDGEGIRNHLPDFTTLHVSGAMPTSLREDHMKAFRHAERAVISNARCLTEGVDVPAVDMVAFISPRKSKVDIVQATGRAMRKSPGKQLGYVMVPLFLEQVTNESIEEALQRTDFNDIWEVLSAMKEQDDVLADIIRQMREDKGKTGRYEDSGFYERVAVLGPSLSLESIRQSIAAECLEHLGVSWDEWYGKLINYKELFGNCNVPRNWPAGLGEWVKSQRKAHGKGTIRPDWERRLDEVGFDWEPFESQWEERFGELLAYKAKHGDVNVPRSWPTKLGAWASSQRQNKKNGALSANKIMRLNDVGFSWAPFESQWEERFSELLAYKAEHGDINISYRHSTGLGVWIGCQRNAMKNGALSPDKIKRLDDVGFDWDTLESQWEERFNELLAYKAEHGDVNVPRSWPTNLGVWIDTQKQVRKKGALSQDRVQRLEDVGCNWGKFVPQVGWEARFSELLAYKAEHGHVNVTQGSPQTALGGWVCKQRISRNSGKLSAERIQRLDEIGFDWDPFVTRWEERFNELLAYKAEHGHVNVPQGSPPTVLGVWVSKQRKSRNSGQLSAERIHRLDEIGFDWDPFVTRWEERFNELLAYKAEHGDINVTYKHLTGLGTWISSQRQVKKNGGLSADKIKRLDDVGFDWDALESQWEERFNELLAYKAEHGDVNVPSGWPTNLGAWASNQRQSKKNGSLSQDRICRLDEIGFVWSTRKTSGAL